jgi:hypothetical protein
MVIARKHGAKGFETLCGEDVPIHKQREVFKGFKRSKVNDTYSRVEFWEGPLSAVDLVSRKELEAKAKAQEEKEKAQAEAEKKATAEEAKKKGRGRK